MHAAARVTASQLQQAADASCTTDWQAINPALGPPGPISRPASAQALCQLARGRQLLQLLRTADEGTANEDLGNCALALERRAVGRVSREGG